MIATERDPEMMTKPEMTERVMMTNAEIIELAQED
jgi:hypothetical protein